MTDPRPDPLVPAEVDLRDFDGFMLNVERLLASELVALSTGDEFKAAVLLWSRAWKQMPAGSLPNDERVLASFSGAGSRWKKVRDMALRGFIECSDGRLYHKVLCDDVMRAWASKQERVEENNAEAERKRREREDRARMFAALRTVGVTPAWNTPTRDLRALVTAHVTPPVTDNSPPVTPPVTRTVTAMTGQDRTGQGRDRDKDHRHDDDSSSIPRENEDRAKPVLDRICEIFQVRLQDDPARLTWKNQVEAMLSDGLTDAEIIKATEVARANGKRSLSYVRAVAMNPKPANAAHPSNGSDLKPQSPEADRAAANAKTKAMLGLQ